MFAWTTLVLLAAAAANTDVAPTEKPEPEIVLRVRALVAENNVEEAFRACDEAILAAPDNGPVYLLRGRLRAKLKEYRRSLADFDRAVQLLPNDAEPLMFRGASRQECGMLDEALVDLAAAEQIAPADARVHFFRGMAYTKTPDYAKARDSFARAIELSPGYASAYEGRAGAHYGLGDVDAAEQDWIATIQLKPKSPDARFWRALILAQKGRLADAFKELDEAVAADAKSWRIFALRGEIRLTQQDTRAALTEFRLSVVYPDAEYRSHFRHGHCARKLGEHREAIAAYSKALELSPNDIDALKGRSRAYLELRDFENALNDIQPVVEQVKTDPYVYATRAFLLLETDQNDDALVDAERALELDPHSVNAYGLKASALARLGRLDEAVATLDKASELDPNHAFILKLRTRTSELLAEKKQPR